MSMKTIASRTRDLITGLSIPVQSSMGQKVRDALDGPSPNLASLTTDTGQDIALAGCVLQRANMESRTLRGSVDSVEQGILLLGLERLRQILRDPIRKSLREGGENGLSWICERGVQVGRVAGWLAGELPRLAVHFHGGALHPVTPDTAYALGLLHDCGLMALGLRLPEYAVFYQEEVTRFGYMRVAEEWRLFGTDHGLAGALVARRWCLPEAFCQAICDHNQEGGILQPGRRVALRHAATLCGILNLAEWILARSEDQPLPRLPDGIFAFFGMAPSDLDRLYQARREIA
ncbi:MAG: HDOD domain-containing protein [Magnetococcales bacterium]|nr:HDOD domain-containing protein [Magnetococcales bacterium]